MHSSCDKVGLKEQFAQKWKFYHNLLSLMLFYIYIYI